MNWFKSFWKGFTVPPAGGGLNPLRIPITAGELDSFDSVSNCLTPRAQRVVAFSREEASRFNHNFVGTEHLLLGLVRLGQGTAITVLWKMGLDLDTVRNEVEKQVGSGPDQKMMGHIPYTPRAKKVMALAAREARSLNHTYIGTEHILLGLLIEGDGVAGRVLKNLGVDPEKTRQEILKEFDAIYPGGGRAKSAGTPQNADPVKPKPDSVDTSKRYDVYCSEKSHQVVVYRNALFKGRSKLLSTREHDFAAEFLELEQSNGQTVYVSQYSVVKFCEHGAEIVSEK